MNIAMVCRLIWKDWYLNKAGIWASLIGGMATLALIAAMQVSQVALIMGMIVLVTILIGMGAMVMISAANERRQMTLPFVMGLPISYWEYTVSKIAGGLLIFFALWVPLVAAIVATILLTPGIPHGLIPFVLIMAVEILMTTCLITAVAVTTESHGWTVVSAQVGGLSLMPSGGPSFGCLRSADG
jgi:ABC-2 type transport system permease protein